MLSPTLGADDTVEAKTNPTSSGIRIVLAAWAAAVVALASQSPRRWHRWVTRRVASSPARVRHAPHRGPPLLPV